MKIRVKRIMWAFDPSARKEPGLKISNGQIFMAVPVCEARKLVDMVHDEMDRYDREQREANQ